LKGFAAPFLGTCFFTITCAQDSLP
jgi:hypothetical protein